MATTSFGGLLMLLLFGGAGLPLGMPPATENPVLSRVAPDPCLFYVSWSGMAEPDKASKNHVEQLLAEEEVQHFITEVEKRILEGLRRTAPEGSPDAVFAEEIPKLVKVLLTHPTAAFISGAGLGPRGPIVNGGMIVFTGDQTADVKAALEKLLGPAVPGAGKWTPIPTPPDAPALEWGMRGKYVIFGVGSGSADGIMSRVKAEPPKWLADVRKQLPVDRVSSILYVNVESIVDMVAPLAGGLSGPSMADALGVGNVQHLATVSGFDETGVVSRSLLAIDGEPTGIFSFANGEPLTAEDLAPIPANATVAIAVKLDANKVFEDFLEMLGTIDPRAPAEAQREIGMLEAELGFRVSDDLLASLGDAWRIYDAPNEGGMLLGVTGVVSVRDREHLVETNQKIVDKIREEGLAAKVRSAGGRPRYVSVGEVEHAGQRIYFLNFIGEESPVAPAWCITENELVVALYPQMVKAYLSRSEEHESLAKAPLVAEQLAGDQAPLLLAYYDTPAIVRTLYPLVQMGAQMICSELQREGVDIDISLLPSAGAILPHLSPGMTAVWKSERGIEIVSHSTLPFGASSSAAVVLAGVGMFSYRSAEMGRAEMGMARDRAIAVKTAEERFSGREQTESMNKLKQLALAMHNYHDANGRFPAAVSTDADGAPLLSWRVHVLPYIEEKALYDKFKLDEPWDSEHNKELIKEMPGVYKSPGGKAGEEFKTSYLTLRGASTIFPDKGSVRMADVTDGTSNTLMIVEAADDQAVIWTKPDDFEFNPERPLTGLMGLRSGGFLAAMADGSVHLIRESVDDETLRRLFNRNEGEVVESGSY